MTATAEETADHLFLSRSELRLLVDILRRVPAVVAELAVVLTRQSRMRRPDMGATARSHPGSRPPLHVGAFLAAEALRNELTGWVRLVCEQRAMDPPPVNDVLTAARWLDRHVISLAMTEGSETALIDIGSAVQVCERMCDLPPEDAVVIDDARLRAANNSILTSYQVEKIAARLGEVGRGLNRDRVRYLVKRGLLHPAGRDGDTVFYRLGNVLAAHAQAASRPRGSAA